MNPATICATCRRLIGNSIVIETARATHAGTLLRIDGYRAGASEICTRITIGPGRTTDNLSGRSHDRGNFSITPENVTAIHQPRKRLIPIPRTRAKDGWATYPRCRTAHFYSAGISLCSNHIEPTPARHRLATPPITPCPRCQRALVNHAAIAEPAQVPAASPAVQARPTTLQEISQW
jgi:hypothetical protein